jgi:hypothetical protein
MKMTACTAIAAVVILTLPACTQQESANGNEPAATEAAAGDVTALNGTWKVDPASLKFEQKPDEFSLKDGTYTCPTCIPPLTIAADGQFHDVAGRPYADSISVRTVDDRTVEMKSRKDGRDVFSVTMQVSPDGNSLTRKFHDSTTPNAPPIEGSSTSKRAGPAPAGAHAASGQWIPERVNEFSSEALNIAYQIEGNKISSSFQGQTYTAEIGGPAVPVQGDIAGTTVTVAREGANGLRETYAREGKVVSEVVTMPSADGQSITFTSTDPRDGSKVSGTGKKAG